MLPPLRPDYDEEGKNVERFSFNASMMNEASGEYSTSNEELQARGLIIRTVLFPVVVRKGDDDGAGDEEIVVCPAEVIAVSETS